MATPVLLAALAVLTALAALAWSLRRRALVRGRTAELARTGRREAELSTLTRMVPAAIWMTDEGGDVTFVNECWHTITGQPLDAALGSGWAAVIHVDDRARVQVAWEAMVAGGIFEERYRVVRPDGEVRWLDDRGRPVEASDGVPAIFVGASLDVTEEMDADTRMQARAAQQAVVATLGVRALAGHDDLAAVMQAATEEVAATLDVAWVTVQRYEPDGRSRRVAGFGTSPSDLTTSVSASITTGKAQWGLLTATDGSTRHFSADDRNFLQAIANVLASAIERKAFEVETRHLAMHDTLTGLPNRTLLKDRLNRALERAGTDGPAVGVVLLSLDHFKHINDSYGRAAGDDLLVALGERLKGSMRPGDTAARLSGDEFGLLCEDVAGEHDVASIAERFLQRMTEPFRVAGEDIVVSASVGVAFVPQGAHESIDPLSDADAALHLAKAGGRGRFEVFDKSMRERALERVQLESGLRRAVERSELRLAYQPVVSLRDGSVQGFEALVRWQHPQRGLLEPGAFIEIAEETGSIHALGAWVLEEACRQTVIWNAARPDAAPLRISVNLSARQVARPALAGLVASVLDRHGVAPAQLALELTETVLIEQSRQSTATLNALDELGVQLVLDDFGTGYSSLSHLKRFPLSELKLDRSYVAGLGSDTGDTAIVGAVLGIARTLGMSVTAEGVETAEQVVALQALGCPLGQGFHFARPMPAAEATRLLETPALWLEGFARMRD